MINREKIALGVELTISQYIYIYTQRNRLSTP